MGWVVRGPSLVLLWLVVCASQTWADDGIISAPEAWQRSSAGDLVLIDIRSESEWRDTGVPAGARRVSLFTGDGVPNLDFLDQVKAVTGDDPSRPVALICAGGVRSSIARTMLEANGYLQVFDVGEGMQGSSDGPGWQARSLPVENCGSCAAP